MAGATKRTRKMMVVEATKRTRTRLYPRPTPELEDEMVVWWESHKLLYDAASVDFHWRHRKDKVMQEGCIKFCFKSEYHLP